MQAKLTAAISFAVVLCGFAFAIPLQGISHMHVGADNPSDPIVCGNKLDPHKCSSKTPSAPCPDDYKWNEVRPSQDANSNSNAYALLIDPCKDTGGLCETKGVTDYGAAGPNWKCENGVPKKVDQN